MPAGIVSLATVHDGEIVDNDWFDRIDLTDEWITRRSGIRSRRWWAPDRPLWQPAATACAAAFAGQDRVDALLLVSTSSEHRVPGLAQKVAHEAQLPAQLLTIDLNSACTGFVGALTLALSLVDAGRMQSVMVCTVEAMSRMTNKSDRQTAFLFGDGAAAVRVAAHERFSFATHQAGSDGAFAELMIDHGEGIVLDGIEVFDHAVTRMTDLARQMAGEQPAPTVFVAHQANGRILRAVANATTDLNIPHVDQIAHIGNTSSATIPLALAASISEGMTESAGRLGSLAYGAGEAWASVACDYDLTGHLHQVGEH